MNLENKNESETLAIINDIKKKYLKSGCKHIGITFDYDCKICKHNNFIERAVVKHGDKYNYMFVEYIDNKTDIKIICPYHGEYLQIPKDHLMSNGCKKCHFDKLSNKFKKTKEQFIIDSIKIHGNNYDYSLVDYKNNKQEVIIKCKKCNFIFKQIPDKHINSLHGCPKCRKSKGEMLIVIWLEKNNIKYITQKCYDDLKGLGNGKLKYDFYIPSKNLLIEYDGIQHFQRGYFNGKITTEEATKQAKIHDNLKTEYAYDNNINLLRIPYTKMNKIEKILQKRIL